MKMQQYIKFVLSMVLIFSNLNLAFSMHYCQDEIKEIKLNHLDNNSCELEKIKSCCTTVKQNNHCEFPKGEFKKENDCCKDISYSDKNYHKQVVSIQKIVPVHNTLVTEILQIEIPIVNSILINKKHFLAFFVDSNAPPNYIKNSQLTFYEG